MTIPSTTYSGPSAWNSCLFVQGHLNRTDTLLDLVIALDKRNEKLHEESDLDTTIQRAEEHLSLIPSDTDHPAQSSTEPTICQLWSATTHPSAPKLDKIFDDRLHDRPNVFVSILDPITYTLIDNFVDFSSSSARSHTCREVGLPALLSPRRRRRM